MTICHPKVGSVQPVIKIIMTRIIKPDNSHSQCFCFNRDCLVLYILFLCLCHFPMQRFTGELVATKNMQILPAE